ncbi:MAG: phosphate signaling complex protein PhoU [Verrucomicrobia bacterium]|nr:phosphate signaling complex protein PhoU [Verrucomicrobiota bacterium]
MSTQPHLEKSLQQDIDRIRGKVLEMGGRAERALKDGLQALVEGNRQRAYAIILRDQYIDELEKEIDRLCLEFLVRQQPVAGHLRFAYATIKINAELERIGDYAESIARQVLKLSSLEWHPPLEKFVEIANLSIPMVHDAIQAFVDQNADLARATMAVEEKVNTLRDQINADLLYAEKTGKIGMEAFSPLTMVARRYERVSDQAKNICEEVLYLCTGEYSKHTGTELFRILFVDDHNACRSQMAEGIANSLGQAGFLFSSAGLEPKPLDPAAVSFLAGKGIDISRQVSKTVPQIPNLEHYQVVIVFGQETRQSFKAPKSKTIVLEWPISDPSALPAAPEQIQAAYEETFQSLRAQITDLVEAILGEPND